MKAPPPRATVGIAAFTAACHLVLSLTRLNDLATVLAGFVPARMIGMRWAPEAVPAVLTPLSGSLVHANLLHVGFNLLMLVFCGRFVEAAIGARGFIVLYVVGAYVAALFQFLSDPGGMVPMIGASGAVSAVVGAYALLYGQQRTKGWGPFSARFLHVLWLAAAWVGLQLLIGVAGTGGMPGTIAIAAHIGGFLAGLALARPLLLWKYRGA